MNHWIVRFRDIKWPGSLSVGHTSYRSAGHLDLNLILHDAGAHTGRGVEFTVAPEELDTLQRMVTRANVQVGGRVMRTPQSAIDKWKEPDMNNHTTRMMMDLAARMDDICELHTVGVSGVACRECGREWPCRTYRHATKVPRPGEQGI